MDLPRLPKEMWMEITRWLDLPSIFKWINDGEHPLRAHLNISREDFASKLEKAADSINEIEKKSKPADFYRFAASILRKVRVYLQPRIELGRPFVSQFWERVSKKGCHTLEYMIVRSNSQLMPFIHHFGIEVVPISQIPAIDIYNYTGGIPEWQHAADNPAPIVIVNNDITVDFSDHGH